MNKEKKVKASSELSLCFFSGLAADASVFAPQIAAFPQLQVAEWPIPHPDETLDAYAARLADQLHPPSPLILGGASFGGIVAQHVAMYLDPAAVVLIGSVRSPQELSRLAKMCRPLKPLVRWLPVDLLKRLVLPAESNVALRFAPHLAGLARQFTACDGRVFRWSLARILDWQTAPTVGCPVFQIHGDRDRVLPIRYTKPDRAVRGGGHVISLTHPQEVNAYLREVITKVEVNLNDCNGPLRRSNA